MQLIFSSVCCVQQAQGLGVVTMDQQTIRHVIQVVHAADQAVDEVGREMPGIEYQRRMGFQEGTRAGQCGRHCY